MVAEAARAAPAAVGSEGKAVHGVARGVEPWRSARRKASESGGWAAPSRPEELRASSHRARARACDSPELRASSHRARARACDSPLDGRPQRTRGGRHRTRASLPCTASGRQPPAVVSTVTRLLYTDASDFAWGARLYEGNLAAVNAETPGEVRGPTAHGTLSAEERKDSITVNEMRAVIYSLEAFLPLSGRSKNLKEGGEIVKTRGIISNQGTCVCPLGVQNIHHCLGY
jgi:hypothetical protein